MFTHSLVLSLQRGALAVRAAARPLRVPAWAWPTIIVVASMPAARFYRRAAQKVAQSVLSMAEMAALVERAEGPEPIDPQGLMAVELNAAAANAARLQTEALAMAKLFERRAGTGHRLTTAATSFAEVAAELGSVSRRLLWAVLEHDASHAERLPGCQAGTAEGVRAMLERLAVQPL